MSREFEQAQPSEPSEREVEAAAEALELHDAAKSAKAGNEPTPLYRSSWEELARAALTAARSVPVELALPDEAGKWTVEWHTVWDSTGPVKREYQERRFVTPWKAVDPADGERVDPSKQEEE